MMKHQGIVFIISDFMATDYDTSLKRLARKNEVVAVRVQDLHELEIPNIGAIAVIDPETGIEGVLDSRSFRFKAWFKKYKKEFDDRFQATCRAAGVEILSIETREDHVQAVVRFFQARHRVRRI